jgi:hypothetical protein
MSIQSIAKKTRKISIAAIIVIFLALIRCVTEPFRLQYYSAKALTFFDIKPFLMGALVTSLALLIMTVLSFFAKYKIIIATCILTIVLLLFIKRMYMIP